MKIKILLTTASIIGALFGLLFLFSPSQAVSGFNLATNDVTLLFARALGGLLIGISVINWIARNDEGSQALYAIVVGNIIIHVLSIVTDFTLDYDRNAGVWGSMVIHLLFVLAFGYYALNWKKAQ